MMLIALWYAVGLVGCALVFTGIKLIAENDAMESTYQDRPSWVPTLGQVIAAAHIAPLGPILFVIGSFFLLVAGLTALYYLAERSETLKKPITAFFWKKETKR